MELVCYFGQFRIGLFQQSFGLLFNLIFKKLHPRVIALVGLDQSDRLRLEVLDSAAVFESNDPDVNGAPVYRVDRGLLGEQQLTVGLALILRPHADDGPGLLQVAQYQIPVRAYRLEHLGRAARARRRSRQALQLHGPLRHGERRDHEEADRTRANLLDDYADLFCSEWCAMVVRAGMGAARAMKFMPGYAFNQIDPSALAEAEEESAVFAATPLSKIMRPYLLAA
jgi:hypothetical protein